ncbi:transposase zinc-binding domain-containing protein [Zoogloea sp.]|uniref:IS91 family transposase n=1 Tax=Zoogloea sp. TaxID=49181 RepID=UPI0035AEEE2D
MTASPHPISLLRQRMIDDMRLRKLADKTQTHYLRAVRQFAAYLGRSPETATVEDLRNYQLHLVDQGISPVALNAAISGLKFFFDLTLGRAELMARMQPVRGPRTLGGHALRCNACGHEEISYNSCRNRHCPKCQACVAAQRWLDARHADLLPVEYYHVVFTLPEPISAIAYTDKAVIYRLLFDVAAETLMTLAADPKHLGAQIRTLTMVRCVNHRSSREPRLASNPQGCYPAQTVRPPSAVSSLEVYLTSVLRRSRVIPLRYV